MNEKLSFYRSSNECSGESFDSLSLSSEESFEDESEIRMELHQQADTRINDTDIDASCEVTADRDVDTGSDNITNELDTTEVENGVDMDVEF